MQIWFDFVTPHSVLWNWRLSFQKSSGSQHAYSGIFRFLSVPQWLWCVRVGQWQLLWGTCTTTNCFDQIFYFVYSTSSLNQTFSISSRMVRQTQSVITWLLIYTNRFRLPYCSLLHWLLHCFTSLLLLLCLYATRCDGSVGGNLAPYFWCVMFNSCSQCMLL